MTSDLSQGLTMCDMSRRRRSTPPLARAPRDEITACDQVLHSGEDEKTGYVRTLKDLDVTKVEDKEKFMKILGEEVLCDLAIKVVVEGEKIEEDSPVDTFIKDLKGMPNLHFY